VDHLFAQGAEEYARRIRPEELRQHLEIIASDEYEGRETGKAGQRKAAEYLSTYYKSLGIPACMNGSYLQNYPLKQERISTSYMNLGDTRFDFIEDFYFFNSFSFEGEMALGELVFVGFGIDDPIYSDYSSLVVDNKVVVCLSGEPIDKNGLSVLTKNQEQSEWTYDAGAKIDAAAKRGAKGLIIIQQDYDQFIPRARFWLESPRMALDYPNEEGAEEKGLIPFFFVSPRVGDQLANKAFKCPIADLVKRWNKKGKGARRMFTQDGIIHVKRDVERIESQNVLAFIEGSDEMLKSEVVIISAHYDHIGIVKGEINNGADDDGSGTVTTLELAEAFVAAKAAGNGTRRSVLILNVSGEEKGLLGSEWYTEYPVFPLENTVCNLNIDMIGRVDEQHADNENYVYLIGSDKLSTELHAISEQANGTHTKINLDYTFNDPADPNRFYYRSDHYNFAKKNIPVIFYFSGVHEDYHRPGDDAEKIFYDKMARIGQLVFYTAWEVANRDAKLVVDVVGESAED